MDNGKGEENLVKVISRGARKGAILGFVVWLCNIVVTLPYVIGFVVALRGMIDKPEIYSLVRPVGVGVLVLLAESPVRYFLSAYIIFLPLFLLLCAIGGALFLLFLRLLKMDRQRLSLSALIWTFKSMFAWPGVFLWIGWTAVIIFFVFSLADKIYNMWLVVAFLFGLFVVPALLIPFIIFTPEFASRPIGNLWGSRPKWPGWKVVGVLFLLWLIWLPFSCLFGFGFALMEHSLPLGILVSVFCLPVDIVFTGVLSLMAVSVFLSRSANRVFPIRRFFLWRLLGPWLAFDLYVLLLSCIFIFPVIFIASYMTLIVPIIATFYKDCGMVTPFFFRTSLSLSVFVKDYWWWLSFFPGIVAGSLGMARLGWSLGLHEPEKLD